MTESSLTNRKRRQSPSPPQRLSPRRVAIDFSNMTRRFGSFTAVDKLNLQLARDEIFCFLGHNGAGKTTSLNVLMGKLAPSEGTIKISMGSDR